MSSSHIFTCSLCPSEENVQFHDQSLFMFHKELCHEDEFLNAQSLLELYQSKPQQKHQKTCIEPGCTISANYNYPGQRTKLYCGKHGKERGMVNVCVRSKRKL